MGADRVSAHPQLRSQPAQQEKSRVPYAAAAAWSLRVRTHDRLDAMRAEKKRKAQLLMAEKKRNGLLALHTAVRNLFPALIPAAADVYVMLLSSVCPPSVLLCGWQRMLC